MRMTIDPGVSVILRCTASTKMFSWMSHLQFLHQSAFYIEVSPFVFLVMKKKFFFSQCLRNSWLKLSKLLFMNSVLQT